MTSTGAQDSFLAYPPPDRLIQRRRSLQMQEAPTEAALILVPRFDGLRQLKPILRDK
jgi:hypothetical protein